MNLTPGGLGVVEAALTGALVALGLPGATALTAVLIYRGITFWLAAAAGWLIYWRLRRQHLCSPRSGTSPASDDSGPARLSSTPAAHRVGDREHGRSLLVDAPSARWDSPTDQPTSTGPRKW